MTRQRANTGFFLLVVMACSFCAVRSSAQSGNDFDRGLAEFRAGNYSSAATLFAGAEAASPGATDALLYQAKALVHLQDFAGCVATFDCIVVPLMRYTCWGSF